MTQLNVTCEETIHTICYLNKELYIAKMRPYVIVKSKITHEEIRMGRDRIGKKFEKLLEKHHLIVIPDRKFKDIKPLKNKSFKIEGISITKDFDKERKLHTITIISDNESIAQEKYRKLKTIFKNMDIEIVNHECHPYTTTSVIRDCPF